VNTPAPAPEREARDRVLGWQVKLHRWASQDEEKRFGDLFNLLADPATLLVAWERVKRNRGSKTAGVDGVTRKRVEEMGVEAVLGELGRSLKDGTYAPLPVRERLIPKRGGKTRRLGIPSLRDRIVQMAAKLVLEPIFEADFSPASYGYRPGRRAHDAIQEVRFFLNPPRSYEWVVEGDVEDCFGQIHHGFLMEEIRSRVTDKRVLHLIRQFLRAGIMREHDAVAITLTGAPQGGILSPLLANIALSVLDRHLDAHWKLSHKQRQRRRAKGLPTYRLVRYADDFVVMVRGTEAQARELKEELAEFMREQMRLTLSAEKTRVTHVDRGFDFLGHRILRVHRPGRLPAAFTFPSKRAFTEVKRRIKRLTKRNTTNLSLDELIHALNRTLRGWTGYFRHAASGRCFQYLGHFLWWRVVRWLRKKHKRLTWKQIRRRWWTTKWTAPGGARLYWPQHVRIVRHPYRGNRIPTPWTIAREDGPPAVGRIACV
jgi:RNA-directed DNA polymerase